MNLLKLLKRSFKASAPDRRTRQARTYRPGLEYLEDRQVPTVTFGNGPLLSNVAVQAVFYGSDWTINPTYQNQAASVNNFLHMVVQSSYMDMLHTAGYNVDRGSAAAPVYESVTIDPSKYLIDGAGSKLRTALVQDINSGKLQAPNANTLYVIYVEPNVAVQAGTLNSTTSCLGYHWNFSATVQPPSSPSYSGPIYYAVIPYPGGSVPLPTGTVANGSSWWLDSLNGMTSVTSHELVEAVTDPDNAHGWKDSNYTFSEVVDICYNQTVYLNGYAVQRVADKNDQPMTPAGATTATPVNFVLLNDSTLWLSSPSGLTFLTGGVASLSDQGIDNYGHAMVDVVFKSGYAYEYHEGSGWWKLLGYPVTAARAGQGVSYVLYKDGSLREYQDWGVYKDSTTGKWGYKYWDGKTFAWNSSIIPSDGPVSGIDAGTDHYGVNMMTEIVNGYYGFEWSDSTGWHPLGTNIKAISAGQQGIIGLLYNNLDAKLYYESSGGTKLLGSNVSTITVGMDWSGHYVVDLLINGSLFWYQEGGSLTWAANNVQYISKEHAGMLDVVSGGNAWACFWLGPWVFPTLMWPTNNVQTAA
jgi:hypothetical protein